MGIYHGMEECIGRTPLVALDRLSAQCGLKARLLAKLESFNPAGSAKDRAALEMLLDAERRGLLAPGGAVIEPTSGNTGIALAALCAARGYRMILTMPDTMSPERQKLARAYGAEVVLTPGAEGLPGAIRKAQQLAEEIPGSWIPGQFENPANPAAHYRTTGPEIWADTLGQVDIFVAGIGTGGTISGVGRYLKEQNPAVTVVGVEPAGSPFLTQGKIGAHKLQGIGAGFRPNTLDLDVCDAIVPVSDQAAYDFSRKLARAEGFLVGISAGAALWAAASLAAAPENAGKTVVVLCTDTGERYLSTDLFA